MFSRKCRYRNIATNVDIDLNNFEALKNFIKKTEIDVVIVGPEKPLVDGIVDYLENNNIKVFGPNKIASQLEGSKYSLSKFVNNITFQLLNLEFLKIQKKLKFL